MTFFNLNPRFVLGSLDLTSAPFAVNQEGIDYQSGDLVVSILSSFLQDGELEMSERRSNMTLVVPVLIESTVGLLPLAQAEAQLAAEVQRDTNTLTITPGDGAPATVFETFEGQVDYSYNAAAEQNGFRQFNVTLRALPHGRSDFKVTAAAVALPSPGTSPTVTLVNDCSSAANWSTIDGGSAVSSGGFVYFTGPGLANSIGYLNQTYSVAGARWVTADTKTRSIVVRFNNGQDYYPFRTDALAGGIYRHYWQVPDAVASTVTTTWFFVAGFSTGENDPLVIDSVSTTTAPPALGTNRQQARMVEVAGSARTQGAIQVASPTSSLGEVLIYSASSGRAPSLGSLRAGVGVTTDATRVSGAYATLSSAAVYDVPQASLTPGLYALMGLFSAPAGDVRTLSWSTVSRVGSLAVGRTIAGSAVVSGSPYRFVPLGNVNLPTNGARANTTGTQRVTVVDNSASGSPARLDELYLFNLTTGRVTIVSCGDGAAASGGPSSRLWLDAATVASRAPTVMRGTATDGSDAFYANDSIQLLGLHEFVPPSANIFTVATNATDAAVTLTHAPRWLGHAALVAS